MAARGQKLVLQHLGLRYRRELGDLWVDPETLGLSILNTVSIPRMHIPSSEMAKAQTFAAAARNIAVLSGAGLSKASGIPTYRDTDGLWQNTQALKYASIEAYQADPGSFHHFWRARRRELRRAHPNAAHIALRELQRKKSTTLITQNIDGLLQRAGCTEVIELHGSMARSRCGQCGRSRWSLFDRCLNCLGHMRPEVILFGEELPKEALSNAFESAQHCDLFLLIGSTAVVAPAAELPVLALRAGAKLIVIDTEPPSQQGIGSRRDQLTSPR